MKDDIKNILILIIFFLAAISSVWWNQSATLGVNLTIKDNIGIIAALIIAAMGSFAGAYGGQHIAEKKNEQRALMEELRITNAAVMASFGFCNSLINLMHQHIKKLRDNFYENKAQIHEAMQVATHQQVVFNYPAELYTIEPISFATEALQNIVIGKISATGRAITLVNTLNQTLNGLNQSIIARNELIEEFKQHQYPQNVFAALYFGLPSMRGQVDMRYTHGIDCIYNATLDGIFFSKLLCADLVKHARKIREKIGNDYIIHEPNFESVDKELMPKDENYIQWVENFR